MTSTINEFMTALLGTILPSWLSCEPIRYILSIAIIAVVFKLFLGFFKPLK